MQHNSEVRSKETEVLLCEDGDPIGVAPLNRQEKPVPEEWIHIPHSGCFFGQKGAL